MRSNLVAAIIVGFLSLPIIARFILTADYQDHEAIAMRVARAESIPPHPLMHLALIALAGGDNPVQAPGALAILLSICLGVRAWLTARMLGAVPLVFLVLLCLALLVAMPLPNWWGGDLYRGQPSPNVWHNPTSVFAQPFALALFIVGIQTLEHLSLRGAAETGALMVLSLLAKPNYLLAFGPCFAVVLISRLISDVKEDKTTRMDGAIIVALTLAPVSLILLVQHFLLTSDHAITYEPMAVWNNYSKYPLASILLGTAFPLSIVISYPVQAVRSLRLVMAWSTLALAIGTFASFAETGHRRLHGNFGWGMTLADGVLFIVSLDFLLQQRGRVRQFLCLVVLALHAISGGFYLWKVGY